MKQAVVILHGMGEQIPMQTVNSFVDAVWTKDKSLVNEGRPDPRTGAKRTENASWSKPDTRNASPELRRITTEQDVNRNQTDFYEFYWAHLMHGTTLEHVKAWVLDLLWRDPSSRVPGRVFHAWVLLWILTLLVAGFFVWSLLPDDGGAPSALVSVVMGIGSLVVAAFVSNVLVKRFGDVARYVKARPENIGRRQEIRETGVRLLDGLIASGDYDRIVVVAHSLGTVVAYDVLAMLYDKYNGQLDLPRAVGKPLQPERHKLEEMIRDAAGLAMADGTTGSGVPLDIDAFQRQQARVRDELAEQGNGWIVSDFITLGSPLVHAEFLMAESEPDLRQRQDSREMPTCPPVLEYDGTTKLRHFTYDSKDRRKREPEHPRVPHHAALFASTRWTNIYSDERMIYQGDLISGPLAKAFGPKIGAKVISGIRDIAVLPALDDTGAPAEGHRRLALTHNHYWNMDARSETGDVEVPHHIETLRVALDIHCKK